jgi:hypothetical protein
MKHLTLTRVALVLLMLAAVVVLADPCHRDPEPPEQPDKG